MTLEVIQVGCATPLTPYCSNAKCEIESSQVAFRFPGFSLLIAIAVINPSRGIFAIFVYVPTFYEREGEIHAGSDDREIGMYVSTTTKKP